MRGMPHAEYASKSRNLWRKFERREKQMHSPPTRTAKDLLLHMADEANTIIGTEGVKSRGEFARPGDTHLIPLAQVFVSLRFAP